MKHHILICFLLISFYSSAQRNLKETYLGSNLKGNVRIVTEYNYVKLPGKPDKDSLTFKSVSMYNQKTQCIEFSFYSANGRRLHKSYHRYDKKGRDIVEDSLGSAKGKYVDSYNKQHMRMEQYYSNNKPGGLILYDKKGNINYAITYDNGGKPMSKTTFLCDSHKNPIEEEEVSLDANTYSKKTSRKFDARHNVTEERVIETGVLRVRQKQAFFYDKNDNLIMRIDSNVIYIRGTENLKSTSAQNVQSKDIHVYKFQYSSLDKHNNWLQQIEYVDGIVDRVTRREIEYYP